MSTVSGTQQVLNIYLLNEGRLPKSPLFKSRYVTETAGPKALPECVFLAPRPAGHSLQPTTGEHIKVEVPSSLACHQGHMCPLYVGVSNPFTLSAQPIGTIITISVDFL